MHSSCLSSFFSSPYQALKPETKLQEKSNLLPPKCRMMSKCDLTSAPSFLSVMRSRNSSEEKMASPHDCLGVSLHGRVMERSIAHFVLGVHICPQCNEFLDRIHLQGLSHRCASGLLLYMSTPAKLLLHQVESMNFHPRDGCAPNSQHIQAAKNHV